MNFWSILKSIGKDLGHVGQWIDDSLKVIEPIAAIIDPPLVPILVQIDLILSAFQKPPNAQAVQAIVQSVTTIETLKAAHAKAP